MIRLPLANAVQVATIRDLPDVKVAEDGDALWVCGPMIEGKVPKQLVELSVQVRYVSAGDVALIPPESEVPVAKLPEEINWKPVTEFTSVRREASSLPGQDVERIGLKLTRIHTAKPVNLIEVELDTLIDWVSRTADVRMGRLRFACSENGHVLVHGLPVPSLKGSRFCEAGDVALPVDFALEPAVPAAVVHQLSDAPAGALVLVRDDSLQVIERSNFVPLTRAAVRMSADRGGEG